MTTISVMQFGRQFDPRGMAPSSAASSTPISMPTTGDSASSVCMMMSKLLNWQTLQTRPFVIY